MNSFKFNKNDALNIIKMAKVEISDEKLPILTDKLNQLYSLVTQNDETEAYFRLFTRLNGSEIMQDKADMNARGQNATMDELFNMQIWLRFMFDYIDSIS